MLEVAMLTALMLIEELLALARGPVVDLERAALERSRLRPLSVTK